ncbi:MAG: hypothetical protein B7X06_03190 [Verrucomicrobia bacterium 21-51-4]|nr:MAG: hypothetical protein B7X06_03190 [Verrucomicrobia bacterium 21-51-4]
MNSSSESHMADRQAYVGTATQRMEGALIYYEAMAYKASELVLRSPIEGQVVSLYLNRLVGAYVPPNTELVQVADTRDLIILIPIAEQDVGKIEAGDPIKARWVATGKIFHTQLDSTPVRKAKMDDYFQAMYATFGGPAPQQMQLPNFQPEKTEPTDPNSQLYPIFIAEARVPAQAWIHVEPQMRVRLTIQGKSTTIGKKLSSWWQDIRRKN